MGIMDSRESLRTLQNFKHEWSKLANSITSGFFPPIFMTLNSQKQMLAWLLHNNGIKYLQYN